MDVRRRFPLLCLLASITVPPLSGQVPPSLTLVGENGVSKTFTAADLAALPQTEIRSKETDGSTIVFRGPLLRDVMTPVGAPEGRALRGPALTLAVLAEATDKYQVGYMLGEIDGQFGARKVIVAVTQDGQPLPATEGPFRMAVADEEHRARWIRQLATLRLVRVRGP